jgi:hypothetical protein
MLDHVAPLKVSFITLLYLCICTYSPIFRIRLFDFYYMVPNKHTDSSSMLFSAMIISRLTAPLCLNFLGMTHMDSHVANKTEVYRHHNTTLLEQETAFTSVQGHMDLFQKLNQYYSLVVILVGLFVFFKVGNKLQSLCGMQSFVSDEDEDTLEMVTEGKALVQRERRRRERSGNARMNLTSTRERMFDDKEAVADRAGWSEPGSASKTTKTSDRPVYTSRTGLGRAIRPKEDDDSMMMEDFGNIGGSNSLADDMPEDRGHRGGGRGGAGAGAGSSKFSGFNNLFSRSPDRQELARRAGNSNDEDNDGVALIPAAEPRRPAQKAGGGNMFDDI